MSGFAMSFSPAAVTLPSVHSQGCRAGGRGWRLRLAAGALGALVTLLPKPSRAQQFVLFDVSFDFTWEDAINAAPSKSHYYVKESNGLSLQRPTNWVTPINYRTGKVHIHLEVLEKPAGGQKQGWALCYVGQAGSYGCPYTDYYTETGTYERDVSMDSFYNNATIDWTKGVSEVDLVYTINDSGQGHVHFFPELKDKTTPTKVRLAMVQVASGSTYDPSMLPSAAGGAGGASSGGSGGVAATAGAASVAGAGGVGGSAGTTASAGAAGSRSAPPATAGTSTGSANGSAGMAGAAAASPAPGTSPVAPRANDAGGCSIHGSAPKSGTSPWLTLIAAGLALLRRRPAARG
jgi:hypothetical protein